MQGVRWTFRLCWTARCWLGWAGGEHGERAEPVGTVRPVPLELFPKSGRAVSAGARDSGEYFSRFLRSGQVWGSEIAGDTELFGEIGRNVWQLSALFALANGISAKVL